MSSEDEITWFTKPRSFLWKLTASVVWVVTVLAIAALCAVFLLPKHGTDAEVVRFGESLGGAVCIAIPAGIYLFSNRPGKTRRNK